MAHFRVGYTLYVTQVVKAESEEEARHQARSFKPQVTDQNEAIKLENGDSPMIDRVQVYSL